MLTSEDLAFLTVVAGSVSLAESARRLNVTPPAVTQRLRSLETRVGVRLVDRLNRHLGLTDEGALVAAQAPVVAQAIERLSETLGDRRKLVSGHLRISAPHAGHRCLVVQENDEDVARWRLQHPMHDAATIRIHPVMSSNDGTVESERTLAGNGLAVRSE